MSLDVGLSLQRDKAGSRERWTLTSLHAIVAVFVVAIMLRGLLPFNVDVSWWLTIWERTLDGQRLYVDILETNPPMAGSVYMLGVVVARAIHIRPEVVTNGLIFLLIAASLALTWRALRLSSLREHIGGAAAVWAAALLTILPMYDFGQREHVALVVLLPALAVYILRANGERVAPSAILIAGLCAATTMSIKPHFVFAVGFCILTAAAQARDWRVLFAPENWIAAALVLICALGVAVLYPAYFTLIYPLVRDVYLLANRPFLVVVQTATTMLWPLTILITLALQSRREKLDSAASVTLAGSLGFAVAFFLQAKGWAYQAYPMVALGLLAAGWALAAGGDERTASRPLRVGAMLLVALIFANACLRTSIGIDTRLVREVITLMEPRPKILVLSASNDIGHPTVRELGGTWVSRQQSLWVREVIRQALRDGTIDAAAADRLAGYAARERAGLVEDFLKQPPDVVVIDNQNSDWGSWAAADPELSVLLKPYIPVKDINGIEILRRADQARP
jgi:hypothetical protein